MKRLLAYWRASAPRRWVIGAGAVSILLLLALVILSILVQREVTPSFERIGPAGGRGALVLYHPSYIDDFQQQLSRQLANGLVAGGWTVDYVTASRETILQMQDYGLIAVGTNTYYWEPDKPTLDWLDRHSSVIGGRICLGIVSGFGATERAERVLKERFEKAQCSKIQIQPAWTLRPNDEKNKELSNREVAYRRIWKLGFDAWNRP